MMANRTNHSPTRLRPIGERNKSGIKGIRFALGYAKTGPFIWVKGNWRDDLTGKDKNFQYSAKSKPEDALSKALDKRKAMGDQVPSITEAMRLFKKAKTRLLSKRVTVK